VFANWTYQPRDFALLARVAEAGQWQVSFTGFSIGQWGIYFVRRAKVGR
jgi:hypothetical protein